MSNHSQDAGGTAPVLFGFVIRAAVAAALLAGISAVRAHAASGREGYLTTGDGGPVADASGECWHTGEWTRGMHYRQCDALPAKAARAETVPPLAKAAAPERPRPAATPTPFKLSLDALFDFDSAMLRPQGRALLDRLADRIDRADYQSVEVVGHADRIGSSSYNKRLSERRAEAVRDYLAARGLDREKLSAEGVGSSEPVTRVGQCSGTRSQELIECLQPDRYAELKVSGTAPTAALRRSILELRPAQSAGLSAGPQAATSGGHPVPGLAMERSAAEGARS